MSDTDSVGVNFAREFARRMTLLSWTTGCILCLLLPATYFERTLQDRQNQAVIRGEIVAKSLESEVKFNPNLWYFDVPKVVQVTAGIGQGEGIDVLRIYNAQSVLIYERRMGQPFLFHFSVRTPIHYNNQISGFIECEYGLDNLAYSVALLLAGFFLVGLFLAVAIYRYPVSIVRRAERGVKALLQNLSAGHALEREREQEILRDFQLAARVQKTMLLLPDASEHLEIDTVYRPHSYLGGDLYFLDWQKNGRVLCGFLVDVSGHGLGTALHTSALHVFLREANELGQPLAERMGWLNQRTMAYFEDGMFAAAVGFELDLWERELRLVCSGIPEVWVSTKVLRGIVPCPGLFLGLYANETFDTHVLAVDEGDAFYFMTDGLTDIFRNRMDLPLDRYPDMVGLLGTLSESEECRDDATAVCIHVKSFPAPNPKGGSAR